MSSVAIGLVLLSALLHALRSLFTKASGGIRLAGALIIFAGGFLISMAK